VSALLLLATMLAHKISTGTVNSADASASLRTAHLRTFTPFTTPNFAPASALRILIIVAVKGNTSTT
jgi:hypothetical protein